MGGASADFKKFADTSSKPWFGQKWKDKIAAGFTNSATMNGAIGAHLPTASAGALEAPTPRTRGQRMTSTA